MKWLAFVVAITPERRGTDTDGWISVRDQTGTQRDEFFYTTDVMLTAGEIISYYCGRWNIETTFQEMRAHLGLETTRGRCTKTATRATPCLFGLYSVVVVVVYEAIPSQQRCGAIAWPGKVT